jgi:MFS family permease
LSDADRSGVLTWAIIATQFAPPFMFSGVTVALPTLGVELRAGATALGLVETVFLAGSLVLLVPMGRIADAGDKRSLYKLGLLGFALTSLLIAVLSWLPGILLVRALQGAMSAVFATTGPALLAELVPPERRGRAFGASIGAAYAGLTLGPMGAGLLVEHGGWRLVFSFGGVVLLVAAAFIHRLMPSTWRSPGGVVHLPSALIWAALVAAGVVLSVTIRERMVAAGAALAAVVLGVGFVRAQRRLSRPLVDVALLGREPVLSRALWVQLMLYMNAVASVFLLSIYLQVLLGHSAQTAGRIIAVGTVLMAVVAPLSGVLADRFRPRVVSGLGVACVLLTTVLARRLDSASSLVDVALVLCAQSLGFALFSTPNMKAIMGAVSPEATGQASALAATSRSIGMVSGMIVTGLLLSASIGHAPVAEHPAEFAATMHRAYTVFFGVVAVALVLSLWPVRGRAAREDGDPTRGVAAR